MNGEMLRPEQGYPVRLVVPGWEGNVWVKWLRRIEGRRPALVHARGNLEIHRPDGERQSAPVHLRDGREVGDHLAVAAGAGEAEGLHGHLGPRLVRAAARSSASMSRSTAGATGARRGSTGRSSTRPACASTPSSTGTARSCCCSRAPSTRPATCSRARTRLRKIRGVNSIYHNNGIQTWPLKPDGEVENVEVG